MVMVLLLAAFLFPVSLSEGGPPTRPDPPAAVTDARARPWANPTEGGAVRIAVLGDARTFADAQRLARDLECRVDRFKLDEAATVLPQALAKPPDAIVLGDGAYEVLSEEATAALFDAAAGGVGLVWAEFSGADPVRERLSTDPLPDNSDVTDGLGVALVPEWNGDLSFVRLYEHGAGRIVHLDYPGLAPLTHGLFPPPSEQSSSAHAAFEDHVALLARAVLWAVRRAPPVRIESITKTDVVEMSESEVPPFLPKEFVQNLRDSALPTALQPYRIRLSGPAGRRYDLRWRLRLIDRDMTWGHVVERAFNRGVQDTVFRAPTGHGAFFLDAWVEDRGRTVDWRTIAVEQPGWPEFERFTCSKTEVLPNDSLVIEAVLRPHYHFPRSATVYVRAVDTHERVVAEVYRPVPPEAGVITVPLTFINLTAPFLRIEAYAVDATAGPFAPWNLLNADYRRCDVLVHQPAGRDFRLVSDAPFSLERGAREITARLAALGVDTLAPMGRRDSFLAAPLVGADILNVIPWPADGSDLCCIAQLSAENRRAAIQDRLWSIQPFTPRMHVLDHPCWSAGVLDDLTHRPSCPLYLLSSAPPSLAPNSEDVLSDFSKPMEHAAALDAAMAESWTAARAALVESAPGAFLGLGTRQSGVPSDWRAMAKRLNLLIAPTDPVAVKQIQSYTWADQIRLIRVDGSTLDSDAMTRWLPWYAAMHGFQGLWLAWGDKPIENLLRPAPAATGPNSLAALSETARRINNGLAAVLSRAKRIPGEIAVFDSRPSRHINLLDRSFDATSDASALAFIRAFQRLGLQVEFVSPEDARDNELVNSRLLVLPMERALSDEDLDAIRRFHARGGAIVADVAPGQYDEHGRVRDYPPLAELFGVRHRKPVVAGVKSTFGPMGISVIPDDSVLAEQARPHGYAGETPVWISGESGHGPTLLLNHPAEDLQANPGAFTDFLADWLKSLEIKTQLADRMEIDVPIPGEIAAFRLDESVIMGFLVDPNARTRTTLRLRPARGQFPYDVLSGVALRPGRPTRLRVDPGGAAIVSLLPYEVSRIVVEAPEFARRGRPLEFHVSIRTRERLPGAHFVHVRLGPKALGTVASHDQTLECPAGQAGGRFFLAISETPGPYRLTATDVLTGISGVLDVEVTP